MKRLADWLGGHLAGLALALALLLMAGASWLSFRNTARLLVDADWRQHTFLVIAEIRALLNPLVDAEADERGYLLTGDLSFVAADYRDDRTAVAAHLQRLRQLTADNPSQQRRLASLAPQVHAFLASLDRTIAAQRARPRPAHPAHPEDSALHTDTASHRQLEEVRRRLRDAEAEETRLLGVRDRLVAAAERRIDLSLVGVLLAGALLLATVYLVLRREIAQRRHAEQAMAQLNTRLQTANGELEAFCYSVSHDLRAPLRAMDGFSLALLEDAGPRLEPGDRDLLERVRAAAQRMATLIDDLLRLSQITRSTLDCRDVDLSALARAVVADLREREPGRRVVVDVTPAVHGRGDERLLRVALENLLGNAWKFSRQRAEAHIAFGVEEGSGETVYCVRDDGSGFDMRYAGKLFGAFQRLHSEREFAGTGIGLATVARVVHLHGGRVWAQAEPGRGATLRFTLPPNAAGVGLGGAAAVGSMSAAGGVGAGIGTGGAVGAVGGMGSTAGAAG